MPDFVQLVTMLREQMSATLSRSDVLKPLAWLTGMEMAAVVLMLFAKAPDWMLQPALYLLIGTILVYIAIYVLCFFIDRDALRSEKYSLNKLAIEHGLVGDSSTGLFDPAETKTIGNKSAPPKIGVEQ